MRRQRRHLARALSRQRRSQRLDIHLKYIFRNHITTERVELKRMTLWLNTLPEVPSSRRSSRRSSIEKKDEDEPNAMPPTSNTLTSGSAPVGVSSPYRLWWNSRSNPSTRSGLTLSTTPMLFAAWLRSLLWTTQGKTPIACSYFDFVTS